jgi:hypothetical protein
VLFTEPRWAALPATVVPPVVVYDAAGDGRGVVS